MKTQRKKSTMRRTRSMLSATPPAPYTFRTDPMPFLLAGAAVLMVMGLALAALAPHFH